MFVSSVFRVHFIAKCTKSTKIRRYVKFLTCINEILYFSLFLFTNCFNNPVFPALQRADPLKTIRSAGLHGFFPRRDANASRLSNHRRQLSLPPVLLVVVREILIPSTSFRGTPGAGNGSPFESELKLVYVAACIHKHAYF